MAQGIEERDMGKDKGGEWLNRPCIPIYKED
jgi:hypothetical protein